MHESDLFPIDMAAEGRGHIILTRALQLVPGTTKLQTYSHLFPFEKRARKRFFSTSRLYPFPILMHPLLTSFILPWPKKNGHLDYA